MTPFDYEVDQENEALIRFENFVVNCVWADGYSTEVLGTLTRPPLAAVARDLIAMVSFFKKLPDSFSGSLASCFHRFVDEYTLLSVKEIHGVRGWLCRGYLYDIFLTMITHDLDMKEAEGWDWRLRNRMAIIHNDPEVKHVLESIADQDYFPNGIWDYDKSPTHSWQLEPTLYGSLEIMDAAIINSGPYSFVLSDKLYKHLTLNRDRQIRIYWNPRRDANNRLVFAFPGDSFSRFKRHSLGKYGPSWLITAYT